MKSHARERRLRRTLWLIVDGLPFWLIDRFAGRAEVATLEGLRARGRMVPLRPVAPNCQTPPSLATLLTGVSPHEHGIVGYDLPRLDGPDPTAVRPAFDVKTLPSSVIWEDWVDAGQRARVLHLPFVDPELRASGAVAASYGFAERVCAPQVVPLVGGEAQLEVDGAAASVRVRTRGRVLELGVRRRGGRSEAAIFEEGSWLPVALDDDEHTLVGVHRIDGQAALVGLGAWRDPEAARFRHPFLGSGLSKLFRAGKLGRRLVDGGAGDAERLLARSLKRLSLRYTEELLAAASARDADLVVAYQPFLDLLLHELIGLLEPRGAHWRPGATPIVDGLLLDALALVDAMISLVGEQWGPGTFVVSSDHGMAPVDTVLFPNQVLRDAGFLAVDETGRIDAARSSCWFHPAETGLLCWNPALGGPALRHDVLAALDAAFAGSSGPIALVEAPASSTTGATARPTYLVAGHGRVLKADLGRGVRAPSAKTGDHALNDGDPRLDGVLADVHGQVLEEGVSEVHAREVRGLLTQRRVLTDGRRLA